MNQMCGPLPERRHIGVYRQGTKFCRGMGKGVTWKESLKRQLKSEIRPSGWQAVRSTLRSAELKFECLTDDEETMEATAEGESLQTQVVRWWLARRDLAKRFVKENKYQGRYAWGLLICQTDEGVR